MASKFTSEVTGYVIHTSILNHFLLLLELKFWRYYLTENLHYNELNRYKMKFILSTQILQKYDLLDCMKCIVPEKIFSCSSQIVSIKRKLHQTENSIQKKYVRKSRKKKEKKLKINPKTQKRKTFKYEAIRLLKKKKPKMEAFTIQLIHSSAWPKLKMSWLMASTSRMKLSSRKIPRTYWSILFRTPFPNPSCSLHADKNSFWLVDNPWIRNKSNG